MKAQIKNYQLALFSVKRKETIQTKVNVALFRCLHSPLHARNYY